MSSLRNLSLVGVNFDGLQGNPSAQLPVNSFNSFQNNVTCPSEMKPHLPAIAQMIYHYIASKCSTNRLRGIHFNIVVSNNGGNPELTILTQFVANLVYMKIKEGTFNNIGVAVNTCTAWVVDRRINFITMNEPNLLASVQDVAHEIHSKATEYVQEAERVEQFMSTHYMGGNAANAGFGMNNNQNNNGFGNNGGQGMSNFGSLSGTMTGFGGASNNNSLGSVITRVDQQGNNATRENRFDRDMGVSSSMYKEPVKPVEPVKTSLNGEVVKRFDVTDYYNPDGSPKLEALSTTDTPWTTSITQPYALAYNKNKFTLSRKLLPTKDGKSSIVLSCLKAQPMDRSAHTLPTSELFLSQIVPERVGSVVVNDRAEYVEEKMKKASENIKEVRAISVEAEYISSLDELRSVSHITLQQPLTSVEEALAYARYAAMSYTESEFGVYHMEFKLMKEIAVLKSDMKEIRNLETSKTFANLITKIRCLIEDETASQSLRVAAVQINAHLGERLLEFIRFYLCIDDFVTIDSFVDDALEVIEIICDEYGKPYKDSILATQQRFIESNLKFGVEYMYEIEDSILKDSGPATVKNNNVVLLPLVTPCILCCTEFLDSEYALKLPHNIGATFTPATTSAGLHSMISELVKRPKSIGLGIDIKRFFVATIDDKVYEANIGLTGTNAPLLLRKLK